MASNGFSFSWQTLIMGIGLLFVLLGGYWTLAYLPIQSSLSDLKHEISDLRDRDNKHFEADANNYLTQKEHNEFKSNVSTSINRLLEDMKDQRKELEARRAEAATRQDVQNALNTTRVEFLAEIKRLDQATSGSMKRLEFDAWRMERDKTISAIQDRQNRFTEALDSMYSRLMQQAPSYVVPRQ